MGMVAILICGAEPFEQTDNIPSIEGLMRNLVKICRAVSEKKSLNIMQFYTCILHKDKGRSPLGTKF